nr:ATP-binding protein [Paenibacillus roseus]
MQFSKEFERNVQLIASNANDKLLRDLSFQGILFIIYICLVLLLSLYISRRVAIDIGQPLGQLAQQAGRFGRGDIIHLENLDREDEIGDLARSFNSMMVQIQAKEEELLAQNEELIAQQDELQAQQEELQQVVETLEENEVYLTNRNAFIQALANTLDKKELLDSIIQNLVRFSDYDKGILVLLDATRDYAASGVSVAAAARFIESLEDSMAVRAIEMLAPYKHVRDASEGEQACHENMQATDLYVPIINGQKTVTAILLLTRIGRTITRHEESDMLNLARQVSLALDKLVMYEETERQRQLTRDMLNTIQEGIQFMNMQGETLEVNDKMMDLFQFFRKGGRRLPLSLEKLLQELEGSVIGAGVLTSFINRIVAGEPTVSQSIQYEIKHPVQRFMQLYYEPLYRDGVQFGLLLVHRDITREYEVDRMKSEFVSTVSHELRTPLASVLGFAELLLHRELKPERQRKYMYTIHQEARRLTTLINDFLDLQRMESGKQTYVVEPVELTPLIREVVEIQQLGHDSHNFVLNLDESCTVLGDQDKLRQVMTNLISNAVKYSPSGGEVRIACRSIRGKAIVDVQDEGLGIPKDALPQLFTKFYRVDNSDRREIGGTGLGLAIVKEILHQHKGEISVVSEQGKGSTFTISLPLQEREEHPADPEAVELIRESAPTVMLVENDHNLSHMLRDELLASGYRVELFTEGRLAIEQIEQIKPDVVVLDLMLESGMNGWTVIEHMKKNDLFINTPIIISSAFEEKDKAVQWGIRDFLVKPYLPGMLSASVQRALSKIK